MIKFRKYEPISDDLDIEEINYQNSFQGTCDTCGHSGKLEIGYVMHSNYPEISNYKFCSHNCVMNWLINHDSDSSEH